MTSGTLFIFVKAPVAGRVKTRLARELGFGRAAALFRVMTQKTIAEASNGDWRTVLAVDPTPAVAGFNNVWPMPLDRMPQGRGDLGARMKRAFEGRARRFQERGPIVIIGADAPQLQTAHIARAFDALRGADAVFGPASDGGYWLIGLAGRRGAPNLFCDVRWSTAHALADTKASLPSTFRVAEIDCLKDVDEASDLVSLGPSALLRSVRCGLQTDESVGA